MLNSERRELDPWGPISSILFDQHPDKIQQITEASGLTPDWTIDRKNDWLGGRKRIFRERINAEIANLSARDKETFITNVARNLMNFDANLVDKLNQILATIGWEFINGRLVEQDFLNSKDLQFLPKESIEDLSKAASKLPQDFSGAIGSSCGAVESICESIYEQYPEIGDINKESFQQKINKSIKKIGILESLKIELAEMGWNTQKVDEFVNILKSAISNYSKVLEIIRPNMGDVHGSKKALPFLAYSSINWSKTVCTFLRKDF